MEATVTNDMNWKGSWQSHRNTKIDERQSSCHGIEWDKVLSDNPDFFGKESADSSFLDIPTYMRRGITLSPSPSIK